MWPALTLLKLDTASGSILRFVAAAKYRARGLARGPLQGFSAASGARECQTEFEILIRALESDCRQVVCCGFAGCITENDCILSKVAARTSVRGCCNPPSHQFIILWPLHMSCLRTTCPPRILLWKTFDDLKMVAVGSLILSMAVLIS